MRVPWPALAHQMFGAVHVLKALVKANEPERVQGLVRHGQGARARGK